MRKSALKSQNDSVEKGYNKATKKLIRQTLIVLGVVAFSLLMLAGYVVHKLTSKKTLAAASPTPNVEVLSETTPPMIATPFPTHTPATSESPSPSSAPTSTPTTSNTPTPAPSITATPNASKSPTPAPTQPPSNQANSISAEGQLEGYLTNNNLQDTSKEIKIGRNANAVTRGFVSFAINTLPKDKTIINATLRLFQVQTQDNPYKNGGELKIDHVNYGDSIDPSEYGISSLSSSFATLSNNSNKEWKEADITQAVKDDLSNNRKHTQYRLHFAIESTEAGQSGTYAIFESSENSSGSNNKPQLVIKY